MEFQILYAIGLAHGAFLDWLMPNISMLGNKGAVWIALCAILLMGKKTRGLGLVMALALLTTHLLTNECIKPLVMRERPCWLDPSVKLLLPVPHDYSFPSGHSSSSFAVVGVLWATRQWKLLLACLPLAAGIAFSRLYLFVHFPSDVLAGLLLGLVVGGIFGFFYQRHCHQKEAMSYLVK